jgi:hypothetical protein
MSETTTPRRVAAKDRASTPRSACRDCGHGRHPATGCSFCANQPGKPGACAKGKPAPAKAAPAKAAAKPARASKPAPARKAPPAHCGCGCGFVCKPGRRFVQGHDARKLPWFVTQHAIANFGKDEAARVARAARRAGPTLAVLGNQAKATLRSSAKWAKADDSDLAFRREVAALVADALNDAN